MAPPDPRLPPPATYPPTAILLTTPSGHQTHYLSLLRPTSTRLAALMTRSRLARSSPPNPNSTTKPPQPHPEDLISQSLSLSHLQHLSDGPRGGIWMLEAGHEAVVVCLVEEMEALRRRRVGGKGEGEGWSVLGIGVKGCEGRVYFLHPCERMGVGGEEVREGREGEGRRGFVGGNGGRRVVVGAGGNGGGRRAGEVGREMLGDVARGAKAGAKTGARELWRMVRK